MAQDALVGPQETHEAHPGRACGGQLHHVIAGREQQTGPAPAALELLHGHLAKTGTRVRHPYVVLGDTVDHDVVIALPVGDEGQVKTQQGLEGALHAAGGEAQRLAHPGQAVHGGPLGGHIGHLPQLAQGHGDPVVLADHGQAGRPAVHLLGLLHQRETLDDPLAQLRLGAEVQQRRSASALGDLLLALQLALGKTDPLLQHLTQLGVAAQDEVHGLLGDHQQHHIALGDGADRLLLAQQTGLLAEYLALGEGGQGVLDPVVVAHDLDRALAHHIETAVLAGVLLQDDPPGPHPLDANAAYEVLDLALLDLAAQIEQAGDEAARGADGHEGGDEGAGRLVAHQHRRQGRSGDEDQLGLGRGPRRGLVAGLLQGCDLGKDLAHLAHPHADLLALLLGEDAHGARFDDEQPLPPIARVEDRIPEVEGAGLGLPGQLFQLLASEGREELHRRQEIHQALLLAQRPIPFSPPRHGEGLDCGPKAWP